ncbi:MAG: AzlD domain-containing protein [Chloroflexi bacterium]|nr:MAG: AzlD domain-containing protein [Chloroflexota bacterium]
MNIWLIIIGMGIITYLIRLTPILLLERVGMRSELQQALKFVPAAVLSAIIFPELLMPGGTLDISLGNERLLAGLLAAVVAWRTKNILVTIGVGMVAYGFCRQFSRGQGAGGRGLFFSSLPPAPCPKGCLNE